MKLKLDENLPADLVQEPSSIVENPLGFGQDQFARNTRFLSINRGPLPQGARWRGRGCQNRTPIPTPPRQGAGGVVEGGEKLGARRGVPR